MIDINKIEEAKQKIKKWINTTPLIKSEELSERFHSEIYLKLEQLQHTGSFKVRGVFNSLLYLVEKNEKKGVITASSGNHGVALAYAGMKLELPTIVVMPRNAPAIKKYLAKKYEAEVYLYGKNYQEALRFARKLQNETGYSFIHSYEDQFVIAGHGTLGIEITEQLPDVEMVITGVGGGALFAGTSLAFKHVNEKIQLVAVQPALVQTVRKSIQKGKPVEVTVSKKTIAEGLATGKLGSTSFEILKKYMDFFISVSENEITRAILNLLINQKVVAEGAGAATVATIPKLPPDSIKNRKVVCIISGGNIDPSVLSRIVRNADVLKDPV